MKITLAFLLLGLTAIFAEQSEAASSSVEAADEDVRQGQRKLPPQQWPQPPKQQYYSPKWQPPKQQKCDPSPYCQEYWGNGVQISNCCPKPPKGGNCYEVCEESRGGGGKKGGFGGKKGGFYYDGPDDWGPDDDWGYGYYGGGFGGKGGKKGGFGGCTERCEVICPPKPKCDPSPYCKGYNCCYEPCEIVCEFIEFRGGKKGGFGGKKGGFGKGGGSFYYDDYELGPGSGGIVGPGFYYTGYYGGKGGKKGGYYGGGEEICEEICGYGPIYPGPIAPPKWGGNNKYPNYAPPKKGGNYW